VFIKDAAGRYLRVNDEFVREFGLPRDAYLGRTDTQIFPTDLARALQINDGSVLKHGKTVEFKQKRTDEHGSKPPALAAGYIALAVCGAHK
jgi:hypothetical protein